MSYRFADRLRAGSGWNSVPSWSCSQAVSKSVWHTPLLCLQWKTPDDEQNNCPKHVAFHSKNKFEKLLQLVGFIIRNINSLLFRYIFQTTLLFSASLIVCILPIATLSQKASHQLIASKCSLLPCFSHLSVQAHSLVGSLCLYNSPS